MTIAPDRVTAVVAGIERYDAGAGWDLPGAAAGAVRIARWLRRTGVPAERITTMLHPIDGPMTAAALDDLAIPEPNRRAATADAVMDLVDRQLFNDTSAFLLLFWAGHGVMDALRDRRLFLPTSTADNTHFLSVNRLLARLADDRLPGLGQQLILVDSCASNQEDMRLSAQPAEVAIGVNVRWRQPGDGFVQDALLASAQGEVANLDVASGLFSDVIATWLENEAPTTLPPPFAVLEKAVTAEFERLRSEGSTRQHPVCIRVVGSAGSDIELPFGGPPVSQPAWAAARAAGMTTAQVRRLSAVLAEIPQAVTPAGRDALVAAVAPGGGLVRSEDPLEDAERMVSRAITDGSVGALVTILLQRATTEVEELAAIGFQHRWEVELAVRPLLEMLDGVSRPELSRALEDTLRDLPSGPEAERPGPNGTCWLPAPARDLDEILALLADHRSLSRPTPALAEFVVRLQHERPDLRVPPGWFAAQGLDGPALDALRTEVEREESSPRKLVIDLRESTGDRWQADVRGYLGPGWSTYDVSCEPTEDGVRCAVRAIVAWARSRAADLTVGFVVQRDLARRSPGQWEYEDEATLPDPLCVQLPVVLHAAERLRIPQLQPVWNRKLADIHATVEANGPTVLWVGEDDARQVRASVQRSDDAYVALGFVPEVREDPRAEAVMAAIAGGAPHVVWVERRWPEGYDLEDEVRRLVAPLGEFPSSILEHRLADPYLSGALRVIWDREGELPPFILRLGEELRAHG